MGSERPDLGSERSNLGFERPDFGSERLYLRLGGGGDIWTDRRKRETEENCPMWNHRPKNKGKKRNRRALICCHEGGDRGPIKCRSFG